MRLFLLASLTMIAFAANSVLNRMALTTDAGPAAFAVIRLASGAAMLSLLVLLKGQKPGARLRESGITSAALLVYMLGFSYAYLALPSGAGALMLFGTVQITMFGGALVGREVIPLVRWVGAGVALSGLAYLLWPSGDHAPAPLASLLMICAGLGWGVYSLLGRGARDPLSNTAANFILALAPALLVWLIAQDSLPLSGVMLAVLSGAVTSGLGYALWYAILPQLGATRAAVAQLTVPVIAVIGGIVFLGEALTPRIVLSCALVLGGVGVSLLKR